MKIWVCPTVTIGNSNSSYNFSSCIYRDKYRIGEYVKQSKLQNACYQTSIAMAKCFIKMLIAATFYTTHKFNAVHNWSTSENKMTIVSYSDAVVF